MLLQLPMHHMVNPVEVVLDEGNGGGGVGRMHTETCQDLEESGTPLRPLLFDHGDDLRLLPNRQLDGDGSRKTHFAQSTSSCWTDSFLKTCFSTNFVLGPLPLIFFSGRQCLITKTVFLNPKHSLLYLSHAFYEPAPAVFDTKCMYFFTNTVPITVICSECNKISLYVSFQTMLCHVNTNPSALVGLHCMYNLQTNCKNDKIFFSATCR
jgi:hypothetical protein